MKKHLKNQQKSIAVSSPLEQELAEINSELNKFLKYQFTIEIQSLDTYIHSVKDLLIHLTTSKVSPIITNVFSKFSNILQPFTNFSFDQSLDTLKADLANQREKYSLVYKKIAKMKIQLQDYRIKSSKMMDFIYMLRINNVNVDSLFEQCLKMQKQANLYKIKEEDFESQEDIAFMRKNGIDLHGNNQHAIFNTIDQDQKALVNNYMSVKSKK